MSIEISVMVTGGSKQSGTVTVNYVGGEGNPSTNQQSSFSHLAKRILRPGYYGSGESILAAHDFVLHDERKPRRNGSLRLLLLDEPRPSPFPSSRCRAIAIS